MNKQRFMTTVDKPHVVKKRVHKLFKKVVQYCTIFQLEKNIFKNTPFFEKK